MEVQRRFPSTPSSISINGNTYTLGIATTGSIMVVKP